jgi:hypothetical protein
MKDSDVPLTDQELVRQLADRTREYNANHAALLAHLAEIDFRRLYFERGYPSMFFYCVDEMNMDAEDTCEAIIVAGVALRFPAIFEAIAEGRLHPAAVRMLAPHLTTGNAADLMAAATHKSETQLHQELKRRFPRPVEVDA